MRKPALIILIIALVLAIGAMIGVWQFNRVLNGMNIQKLTYDIKAISLHNIAFSKFAFLYTTQNAQQSVDLRDLEIVWQWNGLSPNLVTVDIKQAQIQWTTQKNSLPTPKARKPFSLPDDWSVPQNLPDKIRIHRLLANIPCPSGSCVFAGALDSESTASALHLSVVASPGEVFDPKHQFRLDTIYSVTNDAKESLPKLEVTLTLDESTEFLLNASLRKLIEKNNSDIFFVGNLDGYVGNIDPWWLAYFKQWNLVLAPQWAMASQTKDVPQRTSNATINSNWQIAVAPLLQILEAQGSELKNSGGTESWRKAFTGYFSINANVPTPITVVNVGELAGILKFELGATAGQLDNYELNGEVKAANLVVPDSIGALGVRPEQLTLRFNSQVADSVSFAALPLSLSIDTSGDVHGSITAELIVDSFAKKITFKKSDWILKIKQLALQPDIQLKNIAANLHLTGYAQPDKLDIKISQASELLADLEMKNLPLHADRVHLAATQLNVRGDILAGAVNWPSMAIDSDASISVDKIQHPQINDRPRKANAWQWQGKTRGQLDNMQVTGNFTAPSSLNIKHNVKLQSHKLTVDWELPNLFLLAANPFAEILKAWPKLLTLSKGKINGNGTVTFDTQKNKLIQSKTDIYVTDVSGVYDTIIFEGATSKISAILSEKSLRIETDELTIKQLNKGFVAGPITTSGSYHASWNKATQGKLSLKSFYADVMGGNVVVNPQDFDFAKPSQRTTIELNNISLAALLKQHPTNELSGSGKLTGNVPLEFSSTGVRINKGMVSAEPPGGQLKLQSSRANSIAKTQPSMKLITDALDNFHYSILSSEVNYDENGKLLLSVRLEGKNPAMEKGRPINFNVNLEEDVPAMLASMQLTGKVTDIVKTRVQEYMQKRKEAVKTP